jgi:multiple sugar transport system ATP-binding protein
MTVTIQDLTRVFNDSDGEIVAVDGIDLTINDDEFVTLVGPSGCGKTTTLRCVAGLDEPTAGRIEFDDRDVTRLPPQQRNVELLFQDIALYPHMSVAENMAYGLKISGVSKKERRKQVEEAADLLQIGDQLDKSPADLSGGQQQRAALGRSLVRDPEVFLFDEPMSDLDAKLRRELRPVVQRVTDRIGCPVLYVTHDQEEAMTMSDRVAVMNDGYLEQVAPPKEVYREPNSEFVGSFIGQPATQLFEGSTTIEEETVQIKIDDLRFDTTISASRLNGYSDSPVSVGVRPQHIDVTDAGTGIPAEHRLDEPLGDATHSFFDTPYGEVIVVTDADFEGEGQEYSLVPDKRHIWLFDSDSGVRIA